MNITAYKIINYFSLTKIIFIELLDSLHPCLFFTIFLLFQRVVKDYSDWGLVGLIFYRFPFGITVLITPFQAVRGGATFHSNCGIATV